MNMAQWVIRRKADGLFWSTYRSEWVPPGNGDVRIWCEADKLSDDIAEDEERLTGEGEEWVELDDAGQPVEAKDDAPIPYALTDDAQIIASTSEQLGVLYRRMARDARRVSRLELERDEATKRLRGTR
jgi:hypothetical protein